MPNCVNPKCRSPILEQFAFCPACGADNRAPENRVSIGDHEHSFPDEGSLFCVLCGQETTVTPSLKPNIRPRLGWSLVGLSIVSALFAILCFRYAQLQGVPATNPLMAWCQTQRPFHTRLERLTAPQGVDAAYYSLLIAAPCAIVGIAMIRGRKIPILDKAPWE